MESNLKIIADLDTVHDYLKGVLWTIFFTRLFGSVRPHDNNSFLDIPYPTIPYPELENLIDSKISGIVDGLTNKSNNSNFNNNYTPSTRNSNNNNIQETSDEAVTSQNKDTTEDLFYKCVMVVKFYEKSIVINNTNAQTNTATSNSNKLWGGNRTGGSRPGSRSHSASSSSISLAQNLQTQMRKYVNCWEKWILNVHIINNKNMKMSQLNDPNKLDFYKDDFENCLFKIIEFVDTNKNHIPPIQSIDKSPFPFKILFALNTHDIKSLNTGFNKFEISDSNINETSTSSNFYNSNDSDDQNDSMEYITTTEAGDVIMSTPSNGNSYSDDQNSRPFNPGEEMIRNGYKFIKKLLE